MLLSAFLKDGVRRLERIYPAPEARGILTMLCGEMLGVTPYMHLVDPGFAVAPEKEPLLEDALVRLCEGEPIQYILGKATFCGRDFRVTPAVLIPRPETELLCREAVALAAPGMPVLDLCTGSGNIAWTIALSVPGACAVGVDMSEEALSVARSQPFGGEGSDGRFCTPEFVRADILLPPEGFAEESFGLILSNPPYIRESEKAAMRRNVLDYEPAGALFVPDADPLVFYRAVAAWSVRLMAPSGTGFTEINEDLGLSVKALFSSFGFSNVVIIKDFYGKDRIVRYCR